MQKIGQSTPSANADGEFTLGNPSAGVDATQIMVQWLNTIQRELIAIVLAGGLSPDASKDDQVLSALKTLVRQGSAGVVGKSSGLSMKLVNGATTATLSADQLVVGSALGGLTYQLASFTATINLASVGVNGMDVSVAPVSGFIGIYAIHNPQTGAKALLAVNASSSKLTQVYSGANMPSGYTASALVAVVPTTAARAFVNGLFFDRSFQYGNQLGITVLSRATSQTSMLTLSIAAAVPLNAVSCGGTLNGGSTAASVIAVAVTSDTASDQQQVSVSGALGVVGGFRDLTLPTPQQMAYSTNSSAGTPSFVINITKYTI